MRLTAGSDCFELHGSGPQDNCRNGPAASPGAADVGSPACVSAPMLRRRYRFLHPHAMEGVLMDHRVSQKREFSGRHRLRSGVAHDALPWAPERLTWAVALLKWLSVSRHKASSASPDAINTNPGLLSCFYDVPLPVTSGSLSVLGPCGALRPAVDRKGQCSRITATGSLTMTAGRRQSSGYGDCDARDQRRTRHVRAAPAADLKRYLQVGGQGQAVP